MHTEEKAALNQGQLPKPAQMGKGTQIEEKYESRNFHELFYRSCSLMKLIAPPMIKL